MGGQATWNDPMTLISLDRDNWLGTSGLARASDGAKYAYLQGPTRVIDFLKPVNEFGAYWGAYTGYGWPDPCHINVSFYASSGALIESVGVTYSHASTGDGVLDWHGWRSPVGIDRIVISNPIQIMMDGLQARVSVPETGSLGLLLGFGFVGLAACRRLVA